jgi:hypothetical protein
MDLLAGYGSASDSDQEPQDVWTAPPGPPQTQQPAPPAPATALFARLPAPATSQTVLFSGLPKPATHKKVTLGGGGFRAMDYGEVPEEELEEYVPRKRLKPAAPLGQSLDELLPAPKREHTGKVCVRSAPFHECRWIAPCCIL